MNVAAGGRHRLLAVTVAVGVVATLVVNLSPTVQLAYRNRPLHVALEVSAAFIALLASYIFLGRFRLTRSFTDLALFYALVLMGLTNFLFSALPAIAVGVLNDSTSSWTAALGRFTGAAVLAYSSFSVGRQMTGSRREITIAWLSCIATLAAIFAFVSFLGDRLSPPIPPGLVLEESNAPTFGGDFSIRLVLLTAMTFFIVAAIGFSRRSAGGRDALMAWFGAGAALGAIALVNYSLFPSLYSHWVYVGDVLRLGSYLFFLFGSVAEINRYWRRTAQAAVLEERRRLARDLHDGLAQEVTFVVSRARALLYEDADSPGLKQIASAAENALYESRRAISALTDPVDESLDVALGKLAAEITEREGVDLELDLGRDIHAPNDVQEHLLRIAREAMTNATRHGKPSRIRVELQKVDDVGLRLVVGDDGVGFDDELDPRNNGGFGLVSMEERAQRLAGELAIESVPGAGTRLEVRIPKVWS